MGNDEKYPWISYGKMMVDNGQARVCHHEDSFLFQV